jgi:hypothetical protein
MGSKKDQDAIDEAEKIAKRKMDSMYEDKIMLPDEPDMGVKNKRGDSSRFMRSENMKPRTALWSVGLGILLLAPLMVLWEAAWLTRQSGLWA